MRPQNAFRIALFVSIGFSATTFAGDAPYIPVGTAKVKKTVLAFPDVKAESSRNKALAKNIHEIVENDLTFMDLFTFLGSSAFLEDTAKAGIVPEQFKFSDWNSIGTEFLIKSGLTVDDKTSTVVLEAHLYDVAGGKQVLGKKYHANLGDVKSLAHTLANNVVEVLTGLPGIFLTKIAMSCDRTGSKEIYITNFDGSDVKRITSHRSIAFAPAWSPDSTKLVYSLFTKRTSNVKNIDLYEFNFANNTIRRLSNRAGINSGAAFSPDGRKIAMTMSFLGNPEIFILDPTNAQAKRLTSSFGFDVDPAWSPDGKRMAFVSNRTGMPMVWSMNADGSNAQRLTYAGRYNATPSWSPQNNKIAFAGWIDNIFDVFIMNPDGTNIERLTKDQGNNEDPFFSPDGNFILFSSNRTGEKNVYVMNVDGTFVKRLTYGLGNCVAPKWSNPPAPMAQPEAPPRGVIKK